MANVLILTLVFNPDNVSTAHIMSGLAEDLKGFGHQVCVITTTPHYNYDPNLVARQELKNCFLGIVKKSNYNGIPVYHVLMPNKKCAAPVKLASWIAFHVLSTIISAFIRFKADVVIAPSPPLSIGVNAYVVALINRAKYVYNVQELYPDIAINLGFVKNKVLIGILTKVEKFIYSRAAAVTTITEAMQQKIGSRTNPAKVHLIPNYVDFSQIEVRPRLNDYAGNMGIPQNLSILVDAAKLLLDHRDIVVLLIGDGSEKTRLTTRVRQEAISNVLLIDYQPYSRMPSIYAASDLFYVGQTLQAHSDGIPSKIYRILANKKTILAITNPKSDLARCLEVSGGGTVVTSNDPGDLAKAILALKGDRQALLRQGASACDYIRRTFERKMVNQQYERLIRIIA